MRLDQIFKTEFLVESLTSGNKKDVLGELIDVMIKNGLKINSDKAIDVLLQREKLGSTGIGEGVAIPHGKVSDLQELVVAFGRSKKGIDFDAIDGKPVHLFFLLLAPESSTGQHLKALARISKMLKTPNFRKTLLEAKSRNDLYKAIVEQDETCLA
ncbi:MAG TPA: PTS sugar transporter subunit IIA [Smithellaceae bacterium]|jgi:PTS system nitrogen regulatory IIA component|nr:PTS sugar transporter subunit IIA [Syntrophaceae bacterium]HOE80027.1 PTS sugar transporter subunit IIA [Smithellaceae bacterium]HPL96341.1 PTS sugar transporter subunit IIA [Smithellaceae bacterium]HPV50043.1 PTS sugar transporter subunit IIA [Smithellaceae bacterium]HQF84619.1 PTS sugar transporter subunit IIA [Smithellaceae bacterium]